MNMIKVRVRDFMADNWTLVTAIVVWGFWIVKVVG
jgi:hypothetical protein